MNRISKLAAAVVCSLPLFAFAQTSSSSQAASTPKSLPADAPRSDLEKQQTTQNGNATKYGEPGSADSSQATAKTGKMKKHTAKKTDDPSTSTQTSSTTAPKQSGG